LRIVLDTNTLVSGIGWKGQPARILLACRAERFVLVTSPKLLDELARVLTYPRLRTVSAHPELPQILQWLYAPERLVYPRRTLEVITVDPADNRVL
jgi:putative PIN family toxin of toxin-antitoxin system